jgi:NhaA family Na+:H+ antiporter
MSIFIAGLAFEAATLDAAKVGILSASLLSGSGGLVLLFFLTKRRRHALVVSAEPGSAKA